MVWPLLTSRPMSSSTAGVFHGYGPNHICEPIENSFRCISIWQTASYTMQTSDHKFKELHSDGKGALCLPSFKSCQKVKLNQQEVSVWWSLLWSNPEPQARLKQHMTPVLLNMFSIHLSVFTVFFFLLQIYFYLKNVSFQGCSGQNGQQHKTDYKCRIKTQTRDNKKVKPLHKLWKNMCKLCQPQKQLQHNSWSLALISNSCSNRHHLHELIIFK